MIKLRVLANSFKTKDCNAGNLDADSVGIRIRGNFVAGLSTTLISGWFNTLAINVPNGRIVGSFLCSQPFISRMRVITLTTAQHLSGG
jgi:hypothetical protein